MSSAPSLLTPAPQIRRVSRKLIYLVTYLLTYSCTLLQSYWWVCERDNCVNQSMFDAVMSKNNGGLLSGPPCRITAALNAVGQWWSCVIRRVL